MGQQKFVAINIKISIKEQKLTKFYNFILIKNRVLSCKSVIIIICFIKFLKYFKSFLFLLFQKECHHFKRLNLPQHLL